MLPQKISVPTISGNIEIELTAGGTTVFIGANGSGKTRLGAYLEKSLLKKVETHRIAAHRNLTLNPKVQTPSYDAALTLFKYGNSNGTEDNRETFRWGRNPEITILNDFDHLLAALYAEENNTAVKFRQSYLKNSNTEVPKTKLDRLKEIWQSLLPHRELIAEDSLIRTRTIGETNITYDASQMSDGERVIFYLLGQSLLVSPGTVLIIDEPELHINKAILQKLFDHIETLRKDCAIVYITHDVEFAASRHASTKYVLRSFSKNEADLQWDIENVPDGIDFPDDVVAMILGSRLPVLFIEGNGDSLDSALYRRVYDKFTVIPVGSCEHVIHTVSTFSTRTDLHRIGCAGLIDSDGRSNSEISFLQTKGAYVLPVSEVENLLLLPTAFLALAKALQFTSTDAEAKLIKLKEIIFAKTNEEIDRICIGFTRRRIDAEVKKIGLNSKNIEDLTVEFLAASQAIQPQTIFSEMKEKLSLAIAESNYEEVLRYYDNKGLLAEASRLLGMQQKSLEELVGRLLRAEGQDELASALEELLPKIEPKPSIP